MSALSKYEDAAEAFRQVHPIGSIVTADRMLAWAETHANGLASDLLIADPSKKLATLRRHLNDGGGSRNLAETNRFYLEMEDSKRKTVIVRSLREYVSEQADQALDKSVVGAMKPINRSQKAIDDIKVEELTSEDREQLERQLQELVETAVPLRRVLSETVFNHWVGKLEAKGHSREAATHMIELMPTMSRLQKLLRLTS
jgi:hypothetical protein